MLSFSGIQSTFKLFWVLVLQFRPKWWNHGENDFCCLLFWTKGAGVDHRVRWTVFRLHRWRIPECTTDRVGWGTPFWYFSLFFWQLHADFSQFKFYITPTIHTRCFECPPSLPPSCSAQVLGISPLGFGFRSALRWCRFCFFHPFPLFLSPPLSSCAGIRRSSQLLV